ncbi:MAG: hypothetical protein AB1640_22695 [bacterium]
MSIWSAGTSYRGERSSPLRADRKTLRFRRLVERHLELLRLLADIEEKQTGEYILDRQYIEAQIDRAYELGRQIVYDMQVIRDARSEEPYVELDRLHAASLQILRRAEGDAREHHGAAARGEHAPEWEVQALQSIYHDLAAGSPETPSDGGEGFQGERHGDRSLAGLTAWAHDRAGESMRDELLSRAGGQALDLSLSGGTEPALRLFLLQSAEGARDMLREDPARPQHARDGPGPLRMYHSLVEGIGIGLKTAGKSGLLTLQESRSKREGSVVARLRPRLYLSDSALLLGMPSGFPLRLALCCLSPQESENLFYLLFLGDLPLQTPGSPPPAPFVHRRSPHLACLGRISDGWMFGENRLSAPLIEERIRVLGYLLSEWLALPAEELAREGAGRWLEGELGIFLRQNAPRDHAGKE